MVYMEKIIKISTPLLDDVIKELKAGDEIYISGKIYTARDMAHSRLIDLIQKGEKLPIDLKGNVIYYAGPTPPKEGQVIGSIGPTTSGRMDPFAPKLLDAGLKGMIGKGNRSKEVIESIIKNRGIYFVTIGGAGALISKSIKSSKIICYEDLGTEAIRELVVEDFPAIVAIDSLGNNLYEIGIDRYRKI
ncbi:MAG: Fe-S-containing hydro-lyase [Exilispira sp.]|jgi:fumarate hydratase subunit beta|nr:Fe-S-containing hydro-lyase [Exilispira sp.]